MNETKLCLSHSLPPCYKEIFVRRDFLNFRDDLRFFDCNYWKKKITELHKNGSGHQRLRWLGVNKHTGISNWRTEDREARAFCFVELSVVQTSKFTVAHVTFRCEVSN